MGGVVLELLATLLGFDELQMLSCCRRPWRLSNS